MLNEEMAAALEALEAVLIVIIEDAHELAVVSPPKAIDAHRERIAALRRSGADLVTLADACAVLLQAGQTAEHDTP